MSAQIMVVDDEQAIRESLRGLFEDEGYLVSTAASGEEAVARFRKQPADCILLDIWMPGIDGLETMSRILQMDESVPVIIMSGHATIDTAVRATRQGAFDFVEKPLSSDKLLILLRNAMEKRKLKQENVDLKQNIQQKSRHQLVGESAAIEEARQLVKRVAATDAPVLILGEHGTGKAVVAQQVHQQSKRATAPFVELNTASIADSQMDSELFGHEKGAFPGALHAQRGRFEVANDGTIFFDEIGELSLGMQAKVLKAMQQKRIQRLGNPQSITANIRIIGASAFEPDRLLQESRLREDFYYRLNVVTIHLPSLRDRIEDLPLLIETLAEEQAQLLGGDPVRFSDAAVALMQDYRWAGNIRELRNYIERCHILQPGVEITPETMLPLDAASAPAQGKQVADSSVFTHSYHNAREAFERSYLLHYLEQSEWNISKTATAIGMERSQLHRKIKSFGLNAPEKKE